MEWFYNEICKRTRTCFSLGVNGSVLVIAALGGTPQSRSAMNGNFECPRQQGSVVAGVRKQSILFGSSVYATSRVSPSGNPNIGAGSRTATRPRRKVPGEDERPMMQGSVRSRHQPLSIMRFRTVNDMKAVVCVY